MNDLDANLTVKISLTDISKYIFPPKVYTAYKGVDSIDKIMKYRNKSNL